MVDHLAFAGKRPFRTTARAGATAIVTLGLLLADAGVASADHGNPIPHTVGSTAKVTEHKPAGTGAIAPRPLGSTPKESDDLFGGLERNLRSLFHGLDGDARNLLGGIRKTPLGDAQAAAAAHPINSRSLQQIRSLENKDTMLSAIIEESGIDNNNAVAAQEELQQERQILIKANTLAQGIQNASISNSQEKQVLIYISQAQALQAQAHARLRNNIN